MAPRLHTGGAATSQDVRSVHTHTHTHKRTHTPAQYHIGDDILYIRAKQLLHGDVGCFLAQHGVSGLHDGRDAHGLAG